MISGPAYIDDGVTKRKRKIEKIPWPDDTEVCIFTIKKQRDPEDGRRVRYLATVFMYCPKDNSWRRYPDALVLKRK